MVHIQAICKGIGPRPSTSDKERQAANYVEATLRKLEMVEIQRQEFHSPNSAGLLGLGLALLGGVWGKALGVIMLLGSATIFRQGILVEPTFLALGKSSASGWLWIGRSHQKLATETRMKPNKSILVKLVILF